MCGLQLIEYREKTRPRLIKKEPLDNLPGKAESSSYPFFIVFILLTCEWKPGQGDFFISQ
jgi:hypothetical protein